MNGTFHDNDAAELLQRLTLYAYGLFGCFPRPGVEPVLQVTGKGPEDLAMDVLVRHFDPQDTRVRWAPERGSLLTFLKTVLWHDFLDLKCSAASRQAASAPESLDGLPGDAESPAVRAERLEQRSRLLAQLSGEPELLALAALQLEDEGWPGYSNQELAVRLSTTVAEIENRKKRLLLRLLNIWKAKEAKTHEATRS